MEASQRAVALPFLIKNNLGGNVGLLGFLGSSASLGFVLGMIWLGQYSRLHHRGILGYLATTMTGVVLLLLGWRPPMPVLVGGMFVGGICTSVFALIWTHTDELMRVTDKFLGT